MLTTQDHLKRSEHFFKNYGVKLDRAYAAEDLVPDTSIYYPPASVRHMRSVRRREAVLTAVQKIDPKGRLIRPLTKLTREGDKIAKIRKALRTAAFLGKAAGSFIIGPGDDIGSAVLNPISHSLPQSTPISEPAYGTEQQAVWRGKDLVVRREPHKVHKTGSQPPEPPQEVSIQEKKTNQINKGMQKITKLPVQPIQHAEAPVKRVA